MLNENIVIKMERWIWDLAKFIAIMEKTKPINAVLGVLLAYSVQNYGKAPIVKRILQEVEQLNEQIPHLEISKSINFKQTTLEEVII